MAVSPDFLDKLDKLMEMTDEPCQCRISFPCRACEAREEIDRIYMQVTSFVESHEN